MADTMKTEESIMIARPIADVFAYTRDPENAVDWNGNVVDYTLQSGKADEVGSLRSFAVKVAGLRLDATEELVAYEENKHLGFRSRESKIGFERSVDFAVDGAHTRVTYALEAEKGSGLFKFADPIVQRLFAHDVRSNLESLKTILEA